MSCHRELHDPDRHLNDLDEHLLGRDFADYTDDIAI